MSRNGLSQKAREAFKKDGSIKKLIVRFPELRETNPENPHYGFTLTFENDRIVDKSFRYTEKIISGEHLEFVGCISTCVSVELADVRENLTGKKIEIDINIISPDDDVNEIMPLFRGIVDTSVRQTKRQFRKITAYDMLHVLANVNATPWWNSLKLCTISRALFEFLRYFQVELVDDIYLPNGEMPAYGEQSPMTEEMSGLMFLKHVCQINGVIGRISSEGKFETVDIGMFDEEVLRDNDYTEVHHEDYRVRKINRAVLRDSSDDENAISINVMNSSEERDNAYIIQGNMFALNFNSIEKSTALTNIIDGIKNFDYIPFESEGVALPYLRCGDRISYPDVDISDVAVSSKKKEFIILSRDIQGINPMRDTFSATGEEYYTEFESSLGSSSANTDQKIKEQALQHVTYQNARKITITDSDVQICKLEITNPLASPFFLGQAVLDVLPEVEPVEMSATFNGETSILSYEKDSTVHLTVWYKYNGVALSMQPIEDISSKGFHTISLMYFLSHVKDAGSFEVFMRCTGGEITIDVEQLMFALIGQGRVSFGSEWDGTLTLEDAVKKIDYYDEYLRER